jgi:hypothetical protein
VWTSLPTSERGGEGDCVKEGGGGEGERERERALGRLLCHHGGRSRRPLYAYRSEIAKGPARGPSRRCRRRRPPCAYRDGKHQTGHRARELLDKVDRCHLHNNAFFHQYMPIHNAGDWALGRAGGGAEAWCARYGWIGRQREKVKGGVWV